MKAKKSGKRNSDPIIEIRGTASGDAEALAKLFAASEVQRQTLQLPFTSADRWRKRTVENAENGCSLVALIDGAVVGVIGIHRNANARRAHAAEIGMGVAVEHQGKGVGSALLKAALDVADNWLGLRRIELTVFVDNKPAIALYRKFGFELEGRLVGYGLRNGVYVDVLAMARLQPPRHRTRPRLRRSQNAPSK